MTNDNNGIYNLNALKRKRPPPEKRDERKDLPPPAPKPERARFEIDWAIFFVILGFASIPLLLFHMQSYAFNVAFVVYGGMEYALFALCLFFCAALYLFYYVLRFILDASARLHFVFDLFASALRFFLFFAFIFIGLLSFGFVFAGQYERPLTQIYVEDYINTAERAYVICNQYAYAHKPARPIPGQYQSSFSFSMTFFVYAESTVGCAPFDALGLAEVHSEAAQAAIANLNDDYPLKKDLPHETHD